MANQSPKREAVNVVVQRAMCLPDGYELLDEADEGDSSWRTIIAVYPGTRQPLMDVSGEICERYRPIIGES